MEAKLCPKCGAYWKCDCVIEAPAPARMPPPRYVPEPQEQLEAPKILQAASCEHDWTEVVGVELDDDALYGEAQVLVCRLCGLYAVEKSA
ncbi:MAG TPA: hypothetical protein VFS30_05185 [Dehalococcoidia bacterium]|nr:hypothetical protein [Dehalococcoidia bacterium]